MNSAAAINFLLQNQYVIIVLFLWILPWKGFALWKSAHLNDKWWFIAFLILNTAGILEIAYIFSIGRKKDLLNKAFETS